MATQQSAQVYVTNRTDGNATIALFHNNSTNGTQRATWDAAPGQRVGPLTVLFETGWGSFTVKDWWAISLTVKSGSRPGVYQSAGFASMSTWKECQLQSKDAGQNLGFDVDTGRFAINLPSGGCSASMQYAGPYSVISHVFVLMLENHSFDNMFGLSGIPGIITSAPGASNSYNGVTYPVESPAPPSMPTDPGHEFLDVVEQLAGQGASFTPGKPYPPIDNSGYAANYATTRTEITSGNPRLPTPGEIGDVMKCFKTPDQLPVMYELATEFALCDQWYSSLPGPTWPNRFFVHGASSAGWDDSPSSAQMGEWETVKGFEYPRGSIFDALTAHGIKWRIYVDEAGPTAGGIPQVAALKGILWHRDTYDFSRFADDLQGPYSCSYTFIEPNYGDVTDGTYGGGSSQHPMDGVHGGEAIVKATYEALRASPLWDSSVLIITYDEHGGFYDSVTPGRAVPPGDGTPNSPDANKHGFAFDQYGVRVPAIVVSPLIAKGVVDHTVYDHASVLATVERLFGIAPLTNRDANAHDVLRLLSLPTPRTDCPATLANPATPVMQAAPPAPVKAQVAAQPVPEEGNIQGFLGVALKTDVEISGDDRAQAAAKMEKVQQIETRGEAEAYIEDVAERARAARPADQPAEAVTR
jgi:phospholipase C